jgi:hypothetical protein
MLNAFEPHRSQDASPHEEHPTSPLTLNLMQLACVKKCKVNDECAFSWSLNITLDHDTFDWGPILHVFLLVLKVETFMKEKLKILYNNVYQSDEAIVLVWST